MPSIGKRKISFQGPAGHQSEELNLNYDKDRKFYFKIPPKYSDLISEEDRSEYGLSHSYRHGIGIHIQAETEEACIKKTEEVLRKLTNQNAKEREVIVVRFSNDPGYVNSQEYNDEHEKIVLSLGLLYCTETISGQLQPRYFISNPDPWDEKKTRRCFVDIDKTDTVIRDTKENRKVLEELYATMTKVSERLHETLTDPHKIQTIALGGMKLLENENP